MSAVKNRVRSTDLKKDTSPRTPTIRRKLAKGENCPTAMGQQGNDESPLQDAGDLSPMIPMSQDNYYAVTGVCWSWKSPSRLEQIDKSRQERKPYRRNLRNLNQSLTVGTSPLKPSNGLSGFNKFQSKLNTLLEKEANAREDDKTANVSPVTVKSGTVTPRRKSNLLVSELELDDSALDSILLQASQSVEKKISKLTAERTEMQLVPAVDTPGKLKKKLFKSKTVDNFDDSPLEMNDSDIDSYLVQASLQAEEKLTTGSQVRSTPSSNFGRSSSENDLGRYTLVNGGGLDRRRDLLDRNACEIDPEQDSHKRQPTATEEQTQLDVRKLIEQNRQEALRKQQLSRLKREMERKCVLPPNHRR